MLRGYPRSAVDPFFFPLRSMLYACGWTTTVLLLLLWFCCLIARKSSNPGKTQKLLCCRKGGKIGATTTALPPPQPPPRTSGTRFGVQPRSAVDLPPFLPLPTVGLCRLCIWVGDYCSAACLTDSLGKHKSNRKLLALEME